MARVGKIRASTGIDDPYEAPLAPDIVCYTAEETVEESVTKVIQELHSREYISEKPQLEFVI